MDWLTKEEIDVKYRHVSTHVMPFETIVVEVLPQKGINFSDRWQFLKGLFFIIKDGYYFQYNDVCHGIVDLDQGGQPFDIFLDGAIRCSYSDAFTSSPESTVDFLKNILSRGKVHIFKNTNNDVVFTYVNFGYTYLRGENVDTPVENPSNTTSGKDICTEDILKLIDCHYDVFSRVGNLWRVKRIDGPNILYNEYHNIIKLVFDEIVYGSYKCEYGLSSLIESGYDDYFFKNGGNWGCLDENGNIKINSLYDCIEHFGGYLQDGYLVKKNQKKGLLSGSGDVIIPCYYDKIEWLSEYSGLYSARKNNKYDIWSRNGQCLKKDLDECSYIGSYSETTSNTFEKWDVFWMKKQGIGSIVRGDQFDSISDTIYNQYKGSFNYLGAIIMIVAKNGYHGVVNEKGDILVDFSYDDLSVINEKILKAKKGGKCGVIDLNNIIVPLDFDDIFPVNPLYGSINSYIGVIGRDKYLLDTDGSVLFSKFDYDDVLVEYEDYVIGCHVKKDGKWGFVTQNGCPLIPCCYDEIVTYTDNGTIIAFKVCLAGKYGVIDANQNVLVECLYKDLYYFKTKLFNIFVYKSNDVSSYRAFIDSEIQLESKQYWQIENELERRGYGKTIHKN